MTLVIGWPEGLTLLVLLALLVGSAMRVGDSDDGGCCGCVFVPLVFALLSGEASFVTTGTELVHVPEPNELIVIARNPAEMAEAQARMVQWAKARVAQAEAERDDLQENYDIAVRQKWRSSGIKRALLRAKKQVQLHERMKSLRAGLLPGAELPR